MYTLRLRVICLIHKTDIWFRERKEKQMGTLLDAFSKEDRVEITLSDFYRLMRESTFAELMKNAVNCNVPHRYIREMVTGVPEETSIKPDGEGGKEHVDTDTE